MNKITKEDIITIQEKWGKKLVELGQLYQEKKDVKTAAINLVNNFYGYDETTVLFKPTRARNKQFRTCKKGAISYFIGTDTEFPEDNGFALQPWKKVRFENQGFILNDDSATVMGNYYFTDLNDMEKKVEFTLGFYRTKNGELKINVHHSSVPYPN